jgi:hypothetical protein
MLAAEATLFDLTISVQRRRSAEGRGDLRWVSDHTAAAATLAIQTRKLARRLAFALKARG